MTPSLSIDNSRLLFYTIIIIYKLLASEVLGKKPLIQRPGASLQCMRSAATYNDKVVGHFYVHAHWRQLAIEL